MIAGRCDAYHDGHDCRRRFACLLAELDAADFEHEARLAAYDIKPLDRRGVRA